MRQSWWSRGDGSELLFGDAVVQGGLDGGPSVSNGCWWVVCFAAEVFDELWGVVARSSSGHEGSRCGGTIRKWGCTSGRLHWVQPMSAALWLQSVGRSDWQRSAMEVEAGRGRGRGRGQVPDHRRIHGQDHVGPDSLGCLRASAQTTSWRSQNGLSLHGTSAQCGRPKKKTRRCHLTPSVIARAHEAN